MRGEKGMENKINHVVELDNGKKYFILKQAIYLNENYFVVAEVTDDGEDLKENFLVLHETKDNGEAYVKIETDPKVLQIVLKHLDIKED